MPNLNKYRLAVAVLAVAVVGLIITLVGQRGGNAGFTNNATEAPATTTVKSATTSAQVTSGAKQAEKSPGSGGTAGGGTASPAIFTIHMTAPATGATWTIGAQNTISWDHAAGVTGQIELLDASTFALAGVIIPQLGPNQTSYSWNTRDLLLSRTNPLKTTVTPGAYRVRIAFDGNGLAPLTSGPVMIAQ